MNTVESKYKNPDRYIERLKAQLTCAYDDSHMMYEDLDDEIGHRLFEWVTPLVHSANIESNELIQVQAGAKIKMTGLVEIIHREREGKTSIQFSLKDVWLYREKK